VQDLTAALKQGLIPSHEINRLTQSLFVSIFFSRITHSGSILISSDRACMDMDEVELTQETEKKRDKTGHARTEMITNHDRF